MLQQLSFFCLYRNNFSTQCIFSSGAPQAHQSFPRQAMCILAPDYWMEKYRHFPSPKHWACNLLVWISFLTLFIPVCGGFPKEKLIQICLWTRNPGSLGFVTGLVTDALRMGKSLPSLPAFLHLANVDSDTHHQIMFAKCLMVLAVCNCKLLDHFFLS